MSHDPATHRRADIDAVYGPSPCCVHTAKNGTDRNPIDPHHTLGRGGKDPEIRGIHSSILNYTPLGRDIHHGPLRDHPEQRKVYLILAYEAVMQAVGQGRYVLTEIDHAFLAIVQQRYPALLPCA